MRSLRFAIFAAVIGVIFYATSSRPTRHSQVQRQKGMEMAESTDSPAVFKAAVPGLELRPQVLPSGMLTAESQNKSKIAFESQAVTAQMPRVQDLRDEAKRNPHTTPPSILLFSTVLNQKFQAAMDDPAKAPNYFAELRECVTTKGETAVSPIQALCLLNARRLATKYMGLSGDLHQLEQSANPQIVQILAVFEN